MFKGVIIEESLTDKDVLGRCTIDKTNIEKATSSHRTPWVEQWTLHTIKIPEEKVMQFAKDLSKSIDVSHKSAWYADFKNSAFHYIIFSDKVFVVDRTKPAEYQKVKEYGRELGIPDHQLDFSPQVA